MALYDTVKVFDLSQAPSELRDAEDLAILRPGGTTDGPAILCLTVGEYESEKNDSIYDKLTREITLTEYYLHRWLADHGATMGESVFLQWRPASS